MACPWESFAPLPSSFCEQALCGWIREPANTWSNLSYLLVGVWMWRRARADGYLGLRLFAVAAVVTGLGSGFFHASGTAWAGRADYLGMFLEAGAMTALNLKRWKNISWRNTLLTFGITTVGLGLAAGIFPAWERWIYTFGSPCYLIEARLFFLTGKNTNYRLLGVSWLFMFAAMFFWWLDLSGRWCNPGNHIISGHALWHLLSALALIPLYFYYTQFERLRTTPNS